MSDFKKKIFVILFIGLIFGLSAYFNSQAVLKLNGNNMIAAVKNDFKISEIAKSTVDTVEKYADEIIKEKKDLSKYADIGRFIDVYGLTQELCGSKLVLSKNANQSVAKLADGHLIAYPTVDGDISAEIESIKAFSDWVTTRGTDFLYVQAPSKKITQDNTLPGMQLADVTPGEKIFNGLNDSGVNVLDLADNKNLPQNRAEWHFKTDHHWKIEMGFASAKFIVEHLNDEYGCKLDESLLDKNNFCEEKYEKLFLGSWGKKVGRCFVSPEDFVFLLPEFDTQFTFEYTDSKGETSQKSGSFEEALIFREHLTKDHFISNQYGVYLGTDYAISVITNEKILDGKRIMIFKDSFANAVIPFLATVYSEVIFVDTRHFDGAVKDVVNEYNPDMVMFLYNQNAFEYESLYNFDLS